nr:type II toxin-antitoxin system HicA family toxin [Rhodocyclus purpureus]
MLERPSDFTWDEATRLLKQCNFSLLKNDGSRRKFRHSTGLKLSIHEPHPENILLKYAIDLIIEALKNAGEIE